MANPMLVMTHRPRWSSTTGPWTRSILRAASYRNAALIDPGGARWRHRMAVALAAQGNLAGALALADDAAGLAPELAEKVHGPLVALISIVVIIGGIAFWEIRNRKRSDDEPGAAS